MILAIDCGNTHTVLGCIDNSGNIISVMRIESNRKKTEFEYASDFYRVLKISDYEISNFEDVIISSSVPQLTDILSRAVKLIFNTNAIIVGAGIKTGLKISVDDPGSVAADFVASAVAVKNLYKLPAIIIDMGTATSITVVNKKGEYIGGAIMPGVGLSLDALSMYTSLLPSINISHPRKVISTNTSDSMKSGIVFGTTGAVDNIVDRFIAELGDVGSIIISGGHSGIVKSNSKHNLIEDKNLLLKGLYIIWKKNRLQKRRQEP